jgi:hypothetical protein
MNEQEPKLLKFVLGHLVPVPLFEPCQLCLPIVMKIFLRSSVMYRYLFSVLTGLADHLPVLFIETPDI